MGQRPAERVVAHHTLELVPHSRSPTGAATTCSSASKVDRVERRPGLAQQDRVCWGRILRVSVIRGRYLALSRSAHGDLGLRGQPAPVRLGAMSDADLLVFGIHDPGRFSAC
jgi:hypothetical protein